MTNTTTPPSPSRRTPPELRPILAECYGLLNPPPDLKVWEWAEKYRRLGKDVTAIPGRYSVDATPYQREPQDSFTAPDVQVTVMQWASRLGKTETMNNLEGFTIDVNPRGILVVYPTLDSAKKWSKEFFVPMVKATPRLQGKIKESRARDANNTILSKQFPGGKISAIGANSPSGFRQIQAPVVICDEIDAMDNGAEGDPIALAFKRADNYRDSVQVLSSTPTIKGASRIENWMDKSDRRHWFCPCPECKGFQVLNWSQVEFPEGKPEDARIKCQHCDARLDDDQRVVMVRSGEWRPTAPFVGVRGYWLNGINTLFPAKKGFRNKLHQMAAEAAEAKASGEAAMQVWTNTFLAESFEPPAEKVEANSLVERCEVYGGEDENAPLLPRYVLALVASVDVQGDRLECYVEGYGLKDECWAIEYRRIIGDPTRDEVWAQLDTLIETSYAHPCGGVLKISRVCVDSGFKTDRVFDFVRRRQPRVIAIKGASARGALPFQVSPKPNKQGCRLYMLGTDALKDLIFSRVRLAEPGPRFLHWPKGFGFDDKYFDQLTSEQRRAEMRDGFPRYTWFLPPGKRNEALDLKVYSVAAWEVHKYHTRPNLEKLSAEMEARAKDEPQGDAPKAKDYVLRPPPEAKPEIAPPKPKPALRPALPRRRGGFVGGWK